MKDTTKKSLPEDLQQESYRLWAEEGWSYQKISDWLAAPGRGFDLSREWIRRLLEGMAAAKRAEARPMPLLRDAEPEELDDDGQLVGLQRDLYRSFKAARRMGDVAGACNAARAHVQVVLARRKLKEAPAAGEEGVSDNGDYQKSSASLPGVGRATDGKSN